MTDQALLRERRRLLHARVLAALEERRGDDPNENAETLAHHAVHGEAWEPAATYLYRAGAGAPTEYVSIRVRDGRSRPLHQQEEAGI